MNSFLPNHFDPATENKQQDGTTTTKTFVHTPSVIEAEEAEEIGVEHLLRDIRDVAVGTLSTRITSQLQSLQGLHLRLRDIGTYLQKVIDKELPVNHAILGNLQDVFNLLPNLSNPTASTSAELHLANGTNGNTTASTAAETTELARAMSIKTNDQLMAIYLSSLIRAITAFHDLIENKIQNRQQQEEKDAKKVEDDGKEKDKDGSSIGSAHGGAKKANGGVNGVNGDVSKEKDGDEKGPSGAGGGGEKKDKGKR